MKTRILITAALAGSLLGCAKGSQSESYNVGLQFGSYTTAKHKLFNLFVPQAQASVSSLKVCFKRLRFKASDTNTADPASASENVDFNLGEVSVSTSSTALTNISLPPGTYRRVEFDLENHCPSGLSIQLTNSNGNYSTSSRVTIKFSGTFTVSSDGTLNLGIQAILDQLNAYNGTGVLKDVAEAASGQLAN